MLASRRIGLSTALFAVLGMAASGRFATAQVLPPFITSYNFTGGFDGGNSFAPLIQAGDSTLYGTTSGGAVGGHGTIFGITPNGLEISTLPFTDGDGANSSAGLLYARNHNLYGTTQHGGANGNGTIFEGTPATGITLIHTFSATTYSSTAHAFVNAEGANPRSGLASDAYDNLYGVATQGGANGMGTVFRVTPAGAMTTLHAFSGTDGAQPVGKLVLGSDGNFYGTTYSGGATGQGTVFRIAPNGSFTSLYSFTGGPDGGQPYAGLVQGMDGNLYGSTSEGGFTRTGTLFKITPSGALTTLHFFSVLDVSGHNADGAFITGNLTEGRDGNFYGSAPVGGANGTGTLFRITPTGTFTLLHTFTAVDEQLTNTDGAFPGAGVMQGRDGNLYGTAARGGSDHFGTVFELVTLPIVSAFSPAAGAVGSTVTVSGLNFAGTTSVAIGHVPAAFTLNTDGSLTVTVPPGAVTARILVTNPFGLGASATRFTVTN